MLAQKISEVEQKQKSNRARIQSLEARMDQVEEQMKRFREQLKSDQLKADQYYEKHALKLGMKLWTDLW